MNREEFLKELQQMLQGEIPNEEMMGHLEYYNSYIIEEVKKGRIESEVIQTLGNPRLIAKSILDATKASDDDTYEYENTEYDTDEKENTKGFQANYNEQNGWDIRYGKIKLNSWYFILFVILIILLIFFVVFNLFLFLLPVIIPIVVIMMIAALILERRR